MATLPLQPTIRIWNDAPTVKFRGSVGSDIDTGQGSGPSLRIASSRATVGDDILFQGGMPIGILMAITRIRQTFAGVPSDIFNKPMVRII